MSTPQLFHGYVNRDGSDVCLSVAASRACDAWASPNTFVDLSAMARATNASVVASGSASSNATAMLVYDIATFDNWVESVSAVSKTGAKGYVAGLLRAAGCGDFQPSRQSTLPALRYARSFTCARSLLSDSTPATSQLARWDPATGAGGGCEANLARRPPSLCKAGCEALMDSVAEVLSDRTMCPSADTNMMPLIKPALYKICTEMINSGTQCVPGVNDEVATCGFGSQRISEAVQYCAKVPNDPCCSSSTIAAASSPQNRAAMIAGLSVAGGLLFLAILAVIITAWRARQRARGEMYVRAGGEWDDENVRSMKSVARARAAKDSAKKKKSSRGGVPEGVWMEHGGGEKAGLISGTQHQGYQAGGKSSGRKKGRDSLVPRQGESIGMETFMTRWRVITAYSPRLPDEVEARVGDEVTLSTFYNDGWAFGRNERTLLEGYIPMSCVVAAGGGDEVLARPSAAMTAQHIGPTALDSMAAAASGVHNVATVGVVPTRQAAGAGGGYWPATAAY
ncbi:hypothetical protein HDU96_005013 [Phlyctochytrium bullatum]|nr:hypothetical protein HDU96_005013 [Phlyctochytrium bullatum]